MLLKCFPGSSPTHQQVYDPGCERLEAREAGSEILQETDQNLHTAGRRGRVRSAGFLLKNQPLDLGSVTTNIHNYYGTESRHTSILQIYVNG